VGGTTAISGLDRLDITSAVDTSGSPLLTSAEAFEQSAHRIAEEARPPSDTASASAKRTTYRVGKGKVSKVPNKEAWHRLAVDSKLTTWLTLCPDNTRVRLQKELQGRNKTTIVSWMDKWIEDQGVQAIEQHRLALEG